MHVFYGWKAFLPFDIANMKKMIENVAKLFKSILGHFCNRAFYFSMFYHSEMRFNFQTPGINHAKVTSLISKFQSLPFIWFVTVFLTSPKSLWLVIKSSILASEWISTVRNFLQVLNHLIVCHFSYWKGPFLTFMLKKLA